MSSAPSFLQEVVNEHSFGQPNVQVHPDCQHFSLDEKTPEAAGTASAKSDRDQIKNDAGVSRATGSKISAETRQPGRVLKKQKTNESDDLMQDDPRLEETTPAPPMQPPTVDVASDEFWRKMAMMMDTKLDKHVDKLTTKFNELELRMQNDKKEWKDALDKERNERKNDLQALKQDTQQLADKLADLQNSRLAEPPTTPQTLPAAMNDGWVADNIIVGGLNATLAAEQKIIWMEGVLATLPTHLRGRHLRPVQPRQGECGVLKIRWESAVLASQASFAVSQRLQNMSVDDIVKDKERKVWCAVERHPVQNQRRRNILQAVKELREKWPELRIYGNVHDGCIYAGNMAVLKTDHDGKITQAPGWFDVKEMAGAAWPLPRL